MNPEFDREFAKCPCCGSEDRFFEQLGEEVREKGWAREDWAFHYNVSTGAVVDETRVAKIPIGSEMPGYAMATDACMECGCIYVVRMTRATVKKTINPAPPMPPNRAQRRRDERGGGLITPPGLN